MYLSLGEFLRARRLRLGPADVGLARSRGRCGGPGLSRAQVAWMAGLPEGEYADLEKDRQARPSEGDLEAVARALRLDAGQRDLMFGLRGRVRAVSDGTVSSVEPSLLARLDRLTHAPGWVMTGLHEVLAQNALATALLGRPPASEGMRASGIFRWFTEPELSRAGYPGEDHAGHSAWLAAELRAARRGRPDDARIPALVEALNAGSAEFARLWASDAAEARRPDRVRILHPAIGLVELGRASLAAGSGDARLVWWTPVAGTPAAVQLSALGISPSGRTARRPRP